MVEKVLYYWYDNSIHPSNRNLKRMLNPTASKKQTNANPSKQVILINPFSPSIPSSPFHFHLHLYLCPFPHPNHPIPSIFGKSQARGVCVYTCRRCSLFCAEREERGGEGGEGGEREVERGGRRGRGGRGGREERGGRERVCWVICW